MKLRRFYARDLQEGLRKVKEEIGPEAVILHSRKIRKGGIKGLFSRRIIEVIAAVDSEAKPSPSGAGLRTYGADTALVEELKEIRAMLSRMSTPGKAGRPQAADYVAYWRSFLESHDLAPELLDEIFEEVGLRNKDGGGEDAFLAHLQDMVGRAFLTGEEKNSRRQVFIGSTGVGKTTTLAKLAARYSLFHRETVGIVTIDHFRVGAIEQLRTYAEILRVPLEVVLTPGDMSAALARLGNCKRILIDTAGRATGNSHQLTELVNYIHRVMPADINLVLSATTRRQDIRKICEYFAGLNYNRLIVTKLDEAGSPGALLNGSYYAGVPVVYLTDGQRVPDDLKQAGDIDIVSWLWGCQDE